MNIFEKRPLCLILCIGLCGFFLFSLEYAILKIGLIVAAILLCFLSLFLRIKSKKLTFICSCVLLLSFILSFVYFDLSFKAYNLYEGEVEIEGVVEEVSESSSYTTRLLVNAESIDNKRCNGYRFYAYAKKNDAKGIIEGTEIKFAATLDGFSEESFSYNISNGINAYASDVSNIEIIEYTKGGIAESFERFREYLTRYIISKTDKDTGAIVSALLLGERNYLPDQLRLDFKRIGISHILALSGMHLAVLSLGIGKALSLLKIKKKTRVAITAIFVFLYMALTGFSVSVVRAGVMLIISSILYLLSRPKDSLTSLALAVTIICVITPYAIFDISLQLSALATFGIIALGEISGKFKKPKSIKEKIINYLLLAFLASVFAISSTLAVSTLSFGGLSILAPFATIIFSILAEAVMYLGCILLIVGWILPIGWILSPICWLMSWLAGAFSSIKIAYVSSNFTFVTVAVLIYTAIFFIYVIIKLKDPRRALKIIVAAFCIVTLMPTVATAGENGKETVAYYSDTKADEMLIRSKNEVCLINSSQYAKNLAYTSLDFLEDAKVTYLDKYYLTHYSWSIDDELEILLYNVQVDEIYIPVPRNEDEDTILKILYKTVEDHRAKIVLFEEGETVTVGKYSIDLLYSSPYGETSMNAFSISKEDTVYTYVSSGLLTGKTKATLDEKIAVSDYLILGEHGKKYKDKVYFEECCEDLNGIIICSDNIFLKQNNYQFYLDQDCDVITHPEKIVYFKVK